MELLGKAVDYGVLGNISIDSVDEIENGVEDWLGCPNVSWRKGRHKLPKAEETLGNELGG